MGRAAKGWAAIGWAGTGQVRMGQVGTGQAKMGRSGTGRLWTGRSGTGRLRKKLQQTILLLTGLDFVLLSSFLGALLGASLRPLRGPIRALPGAP
jgi:hypothetical protein